LYRTNDGPAILSPWILITYVLENEEIQRKLSYYEFREEFKRIFGPNFLKNEYTVDQKESLKFEKILEMTKSKESALLLTQFEKLKRVNEIGKRQAPNKNLTNLITPRISDDLAISFQSFKNESMNWLEMNLSVETMSLELELITLIDFSISFLDYISTNEPRFFAINYKKTRISSNAYVFVYYCPESVSVRLKMLYSLCKAPIIEMIHQKFGITFRRVLQVSEQESFSKSLTTGLKEHHTGKGSISRSSTGYFKPTRPGRGKARLINKDSA